MLILTHKQDESIMIDDTVEIVVLSDRRTPIKIGIKAPLEIPVHRQEIYKRIKNSHSIFDEKLFRRH